MQVRIFTFSRFLTLSRLKLNELFTLDDNNRGTRGHSWKLALNFCAHGTAVSSVFQTE